MNQKAKRQNALDDRIESGCLANVAKITLRLEPLLSECFDCLLVPCHENDLRTQWL
jgi:hypothetical protein